MSLSSTSRYRWWGAAAAGMFGGGDGVAESVIEIAVGEDVFDVGAAESKAMWLGAKYSDGASSMFV